ncbi:MAG: AAA family ATPase [Gaiellaceae bacterium]
MECRVICISHATGAGGEEVGRLVADQLGFLYVDDEIVARAAAKAGVGHDEVADAERRRSLIVRALDAIAEGGGETWTIGTVGLPPTGRELGRYDLLALIREAIEQAAARGNVVIVAHAASHVVARSPDALRVLVTASPDTRATRLAALEEIDPNEARRKIKDADAGRRDYLKSFHGVDQEAPTHYDLVLNTDVLPIEDAARVISLISRAPERAAH